MALGLAEAGQRGQGGLCLTGKPFLPFKPQPLGLGAFLASICVFTFQVQTSTSESSGAGSVTMPNATSSCNGMDWPSFSFLILRFEAASWRFTS